MNSGLTDGTLCPIVGEVFEGLDSIRDAHRLMESNRHTGKIVVRIRGPRPIAAVPEYAPALRG
ncbi:zinc-binding dehydrogenase [Streptomyces sp. NPDC001982]|uniref:zinc-binding dehydrogenase n=1 Tax=unclassified Streptomyces TaxID=2593676 RepID=UPI00331A48B2